MSQTSSASGTRGKHSKHPGRPGRPGNKTPGPQAGAPLRRPEPLHTSAAVAGPRQGWREAIATTVAGLGYGLVDVERAQRGLLRVTIDRIAGRAYPVPGDFVIVEDCEQVTRQLQYVLEVEGLDYARLEVSSPGLDRPLKTEADFQRFAGQMVSVTLKAPFEGRKSWQGVLRTAEAAAEPAGSAAGPGGWTLVFKNGKTEQVLGFNLAEVRDAHLVPVVDFKGRQPGGAKGTAADGGNNGEQAGRAPDVAAAPGEDGG